MRALLVVLLICVAALVAGEEKIEYYDSKFDDVDLNLILNNDRLREQYYKCMSDEGPCLTADAKFTKDILAEAIATRCKRCTEKQKSNFQTVTEWYIENQPEKLENLIRKILQKHSPGTKIEDLKVEDFAP